MVVLFTWGVNIFEQIYTFTKSIKVGDFSVPSSKIYLLINDNGPIIAFYSTVKCDDGAHLSVEQGIHFLKINRFASKDVLYTCSPSKHPACKMFNIAQNQTNHHSNKGKNRWHYVVKYCFLYNKTISTLKFQTKSYL